MDIKIKIKKTKDEKIFNLLKGIIQDIGKNSFSELHIDTEFITPILHVRNSLDALMKHPQYNFFIEEIKKDGIKIKNITLRLSLIVASNQSFPVVRYFDQIDELYSLVTVTWENQLSVEQIKIVQTIKNYILQSVDEFNPGEFYKNFNDPLINNYLKLQEAKIGELESVLEKQIRIIGEQTAKWNDLSITFQKSLQEKYENDLAKLNESFRQKDAELAKREGEFNDRVREFDLRERTAVRRDLLTQIKSLIKDREEIQLSDETSKKRNVINLISLGFLALSGTSLVTVLIKFYLDYSEKGVFQFPILYPLVGITPLFVSLLIFVIRWYSAWYKEHADLEISNIKFGSDILRASWVAEMYFELREENELELPTEILQAFTRNLFEPIDNTKHPITHPYDDILKNMTDLKRLKFGKGTFEIEKS